MNFDKILQWVKVLNADNRDKLGPVLEFIRDLYEQEKPELLEVIRNSGCKVGSEDLETLIRRIVKEELGK